MNSTVGPVYFPDTDKNNSTEKPFSKALESIIDIEARKTVESAYQKAEELLKTNKDKLKKVCEQNYWNE